MSECKSLLLELGTEELPPRALPTLSQGLADGMAVEFERAGLKHGGIRQFATPRRLALLVEALPVNQPDQVLERRGPPVASSFDAEDRPNKAAQGFAKSCGVDVHSLERVETDKGIWLYCRLSRPGEATCKLLPAMIANALTNIPAPKRMRWGAGEVEFVRPVHWVVVLFGEEVVDAEILGMKSGRQTRGHRFHHPEPLSIATPGDYASLLEHKGKVVADFGLRRQRIRQQVEALAATLGGRVVMEDALLDEVTALVEWPQALAGDFDEAYLEIPREVLITTMQANQRYFPVAAPDGRLLARFIAVSNIESTAPEVVRAGNERVIRPRFSDAAFFWQQDRKTTLASRREALKTIVFQEQLGTLFDKTVRVERLAGIIAEHMSIDVDQVRRAAALSKCDLLTHIVFEFPNLQGIMGRYYAAGDGEHESVAIALDEQYMPRHAGDTLPRTPTGQALALADRLDTLSGIFATGYRPTGEKDPFGLRRAALGVLRIVIECQIELDLAAALGAAADGLPRELNGKRATSETFDYILERLKTYHLDRGIAPDVFNAVMARRPTQPLDFDRRVRAVQAFRELPEAEGLASANKRIANILKQVEGAPLPQVNESLLCDDAERELHRQLGVVHHKVEPLFEAGEYHQALATLAGLRGVVDRFFDDVLVMAPDQAVKNNRMALLDRLRGLFLRVADISRLQ